MRSPIRQDPEVSDFSNEAEGSAPLARKRILLCVGGGIAAYKIPELVRHFVREGDGVRCALTEAAAEFVSPLVLQTLSGHAVRSALFSPEEEGQIDHIALADDCDLVIVAPATANRLAKLAAGIADDLVSTLLLATRAPVLCAPAMNVNMWNHPATQSHVETLRERGVYFVGPDSGFLACGWEGAGRMAEPDAIARAARFHLAPKTLEGEVVLITAGGTREAIDPVRALTNRSSGKMGFAMAEVAARRGAEVILVAAPCAVATPHGVKRIDVESALEMRDAVRSELERSTLFVGAAAVADFRPAERAEHKIKKESVADALRLELVRNPDILAEVATRSATSERSARRRLVVGFAAESRDLLVQARAKLERKGCDLVVANDISRSDAGFETDTNAVLLVWPDGRNEALPLASKTEIAGAVLDRASALRSSLL